MDVAAADVELLALRAFGELGAGGVEVVEAAEEEGRVGEVGEGLDAVVDLGLEDDRVDPVRGDVADVEGLDVLAHGAQGRARGGEVGPFAAQRVGGRGRVVGGGVGGVRGHGTASSCWYGTDAPGFRPVGGSPR